MVSPGLQGNSLTAQIPLLIVINALPAPRTFLPTAVITWQLCLHDHLANVQQVQSVQSVISPYCFQQWPQGCHRLEAGYPWAEKDGHLPCKEQQLKTHLGTGELSQCLRSLDALLEDLG